MRERQASLLRGLYGIADAVKRDGALIGNSYRLELTRGEHICVVEVARVRKEAPHAWYKSLKVNDERTETN